MKYFIYCRKSSEDKSRQIQSIDDQKQALIQIAKQRGLSIADIIVDEKSAKKPGRKGFSEMIERIQTGEVTGILCWKLDRLARNPVDGGNITWLLQQGRIQEIVTPDKTFLPNDNVLLIGIEFGMANQYIIDLSKSVKRGMNSKIDKGWLPTLAPIGYINEVHAEKGAKRILPDPDTFDLIRGLWKRLIGDKLKLFPLYRIMADESPIYRNGSIIAMSSFHKIFHNPFYAGLFKWNGETHIGSHQPMITMREFEKAQQILENETQIRETNLNFDLKGFFRCGVCDAQITAQRCTKFIKCTQQTKSFDYYKCSHRKKGIKCNQTTASQKELEAQIVDYIDELRLPDEIIAFGLKELESMKAQDSEPVKVKLIKSELNRIDKRLNRAMELMLDDVEPEILDMTRAKILELKIDRKRKQEELDLVVEHSKDPTAEFRNSLELIMQAKYTFLNGSPTLKRKVINGLGSNWKLEDKKLYFKPLPYMSAFKEANSRLKRGNFGIKPKEAQEDNKKLPLETVSLVWSG